MRTLKRFGIWLCACAVVGAGRSAFCGGGVTLDGTAGPARTLSLVGSTFVVDAADGRRVGNSLFQSFGQLSLASGQTLQFTGPSAITVIIARVTGGTPSQIDGTIDTNSSMPNAHLYLINPAGINFGSTASLNVGKSFTATTADNVKLSDGTVVNSTGPLPSVLTCAPPEDFGFVAPHKGSIQVQGATLAVGEGMTVALISGSVHLQDVPVPQSDGSTLTQRSIVRAPDGNVQIVAVGNSGTVHDDIVNGGMPVLTAPASAGEATIDANSALVTSKTDGGRIDVAAQQINILGTVIAEPSGTTAQGVASAINLTAIQDCTIRGTVTTNSNGSQVQPAGPITMRVGGALEILPNGLISANSQDPVSGGLITITAQNLLINSFGSTSQTGITAQATGTGSAGDIDIQAHSVTVGHFGWVMDSSGKKVRSPATISTVTSSQGDAGNITISADALNIIDGAQILAQTEGSGAGGTIVVHAGSIHIAGVANLATGLIADTNEGSTGAGGTIVVDQCQTLDIQPLGIISTTTNGTGRGGGIDVTADSIVMDGGNLGGFTGIGANAQSTQVGAGGGGDVHVSASTISILQGSAIAANTFGPGAGGSIVVTATQRLLAEGAVENPVTTGIYAKSLGANSSGDGGNVTIHAAALSLTRSAAITTASDGLGNAGNVSIDGTTATINQGGTIASSAGGAGSAGGVTLAFSGNLAGDNATLSVAAGLQSGGDINISAQSILLTDSSVTAQAHLDGGSIIFQAAERIVLTDCVLNAKAGGNGGSIQLDPSYVVLNSSDLTADAVNGNGGSIQITALWYLPSADSSLTVSSTFGVLGNITIQTPNPIATVAVGALPVELPQSQGLLTDSCEVRFSNSATSLLVMPSYNPSALPPLLLPVGSIAQALQNRADDGK